MPDFKRLPTYELGSLFQAGLRDLDAVVDPALLDADEIAVDHDGEVLRSPLSLLKSTLKTYFDTLYVALTGAQTIGGVKDFTNGIKVANGTTLTHLSSGTYTPLVGGSGGNPVFSGASLGGHYLRINNWVLMHADVSVGTITTPGVGDIRINLPFTAANFNLMNVNWNNLDVAGGATQVNAITIAGALYCLLVSAVDNGANGNTQHTGLSTGDAINITGIYQV